MLSLKISLIEYIFNICFSAKHKDSCNTNNLPGRAFPNSLSVCVKGRAFISFQKHNKYDGVRVGTKSHLKGLPVGEMSVRGREVLIDGGRAGCLPLLPIRLYVALRILGLNEE